MRADAKEFEGAVSPEVGKGTPVLVLLCLAAAFFPAPVQAAPLERTDPVPADAGAQRDIYHFGHYQLNNVWAPFDFSVSLERLEEVTSRSAARWGISYDGQTARDIGPDGYPVVGFSYDLNSETLGQTDIYTQAIRKRKCKRKHGRRRCRQRVVATRIADEDISWNGNVPWAPGPDYPDAAHYDFETVVIHEFGHFAGNEHIGGCANTPMFPFFDVSEYWRGSNEWLRIDCANSIPGPPLAASRSEAGGDVSDHLPVRYGESASLAKADVDAGASAGPLRFRTKIHELPGDWRPDRGAPRAPVIER